MTCCAEFGELQSVWWVLQRRSREWGPKAGEFGRWHVCAYGPGEASPQGRLCAGPAGGCIGQRRHGRWASWRFSHDFPMRGDYVSSSSFFFSYPYPLVTIGTSVRIVVSRVPTLVIRVPTLVIRLPSSL